MPTRQNRLISTSAQPTATPACRLNVDTSTCRFARRVGFRLSRSVRSSVLAHCESALASAHIPGPEPVYPRLRTSSHSYIRLRTRAGPRLFCSSLRTYLASAGNLIEGFSKIAIPHKYEWTANYQMPFEVLGTPRSHHRLYPSFAIPTPWGHATLRNGPVMLCRVTCAPPGTDAIMSNAAPTPACGPRSSSYTCGYNDMSALISIRISTDQITVPVLLSPDRRLKRSAGG